MRMRAARGDALEQRCLRRDSEQQLMMLMLTDSDVAFIMRMRADADTRHATAPT